MTTKVRIATVKATGKRYIVQRLYLPTQSNEVAKVFCWGDVVAVQGTSLKHSEAHTFVRDAVDVVEVDRTRELCEELFDQAMRERIEAGTFAGVRTRRVRVRR
jgi:hypothetical protein